MHSRPLRAPRALRAARAAAPLILAALVALVACSSTTGLPAAQITNVVDTVTLFAIDGTPLDEPSGFVLLDAQAVRVDQNPNFDFAFDFDSLKRAELLPSGATPLGQSSGILGAPQPFEAITTAPTSTFDVATPVLVDTGTTVVIRSRPTTCSFGSVLPLYAKLKVLAIDTAATARSIRFEILVDQNCGYRGLAPGLPTS